MASHQSQWRRSGRLPFPSMDGHWCDMGTRRGRDHGGFVSYLRATCHHLRVHEWLMGLMFGNLWQNSEITVAAFKIRHTTLKPSLWTLLNDEDFNILQSVYYVVIT